jgi:hypothetical protein
MHSRRLEINNSYAVEAPLSRRDQKARISFFDPVNQATLDRLILGSEPQADVEGDEESARATLASVEEMIEGYEWASDDVIGRKMTKGTVDMIEARLLDELTALEKASSAIIVCSAISRRLLGKHIFISGVRRTYSSRYEIHRGCSIGTGQYRRTYFIIQDSSQRLFIPGLLAAATHPI